MIGAYLTDRATWHRDQGHDQWGTKLARADKAIACRVKGQGRVVRDWRGTEVMSETSIFVTQKPKPDDQFTLTSLGAERPFSVAAIKRHADFQTCFWEVFLV